MIPKIVALFLGVSWLQMIYGAAYSKVYVQSGAEVVPVEYVNYGAPRVVTNGQIAALSAPPIGSALPLPNLVSPCVAPCVLPSQAVGTFAPIPSNAKILSYSAPSVPAVVVPANDDQSSYEYSYVVYDENTGDRKAQRELSDGSVVHGEYSFVQPDGYVREVKYTADDLTGFNAVVKSFLPESVFGINKKKPEAKEKSEPPPCKETKSEALKVEPEHDHEKPSVPENSDAHAPVQEAHGELSVVPVDHVSEHAVKEPPIHEAEHGAHTSELSVEVHVDAPEPVASHAPEQAPEHKPEPPPEISKPASEPHSDQLDIHFETPEEHAKHGAHHAQVIVHPAEPAEHPDEPSHADAGHEAVPVAQPVELIPTPIDDCGEKTVTHEAVQAPNPQVSIPNGLATYNDIIRCIQAAMANKDSNSPSISPLTYIILPVANKPC